jgi:hypothetical protein
MEWICRMVLGATEGTGSVATLQLSFIAGVQLAEVGGTLRCVEEDLAPTVVAAGAGATAAPADPSPVHALAWARCVGCYAQLQRVLADAESSLHQPPWMSDRVLEAVAKPLACPVDTRELDGWTAVWDDATAGYYFAHLATVGGRRVMRCNSPSKPPPSPLHYPTCPTCALFFRPCALLFPSHRVSQVGTCQLWQRCPWVSPPSACPKPRGRTRPPSGCTPFTCTPRA